MEVRRSCTQGGHGKSDGESMVTSINRPTLALYRKSKEVYDKTRYDKLMESRRALSVETKGTRGTRGEVARAGSTRVRRVTRGQTTAIAAEGGYSGGLGAPPPAENLGFAE